MTIVDIAREIAIEAHADRRNKHDDSIYLRHVNAVAVEARLRAGMWGVPADLAEALGWIHDVPEDEGKTEDGAWTINRIRLWFRERGYEGEPVNRVLHALGLMTKDGSLTNVEYITEICDDPDPLAACGKDADSTVNLSGNDLIEEPEKRTRMAGKYTLYQRELRKRRMRVALWAIESLKRRAAIAGGACTTCAHPMSEHTRPYGKQMACAHPRDRGHCSCAGFRRDP